MAESPPTGGLSALTGCSRPSSGSGQDVVQRRREALARLLELPLDVQARRAGLGPQLEEVGPARQVRVVGLGDRLDPVDLAWRQHEGLGALVLDATPHVLDLEPVAGHDAELLVVAVHDELDDVLERPVHPVGHQLQRFGDLLRSAQLVARRQAEPAIEVVLARCARLAADALGQPRGAEREDPRLDRFLERAVAARQLRGDGATVLGVPRGRYPVHENRRRVVAAIARAGTDRGVEDDEVVAHYAGSNRIEQLVEGVVGAKGLHPTNTACGAVAVCDTGATLRVPAPPAPTRTILRGTREEGRSCPHSNPPDRSRNRSPQTSWLSKLGSTAARPWSRFAASSTSSRCQRSQRCLTV